MLRLVRSLRREGAFLGAGSLTTSWQPVLSGTAAP